MFQVRRMLETEMTREFAHRHPARIRRCASTWPRKRPRWTTPTPPHASSCWATSMRMAELTGNEVLAQILRDLISAVPSFP